MNRRSLFKGVAALIGAAFLPKAKAEPCAWHPKGCIGDACAGKPALTFHQLTHDMTHAQYERVKNLYGDYARFQVADKRRSVGYNNTVSLTSMNGEAYVIHYREVEDRPDHMFAGSQMFHGNSWEEAIVYAETYKKWLEFHGDGDGKWLQETVRRNPVQGRYFYTNEVEMKGRVEDLDFRYYSL